MDATINIVFGVFMAGLGLITIYQAARLAALQTRRRRLNLMLLRLPTSFSTLLIIERQSSTEVRATCTTSK